MSVSTPLLEGCESPGLHVGYSLEYADHKKGPSVPALSSTALPDLLGAINHLRLGMSTPLDEDQSSDEQQDLLESLVAKGVLRSSKTKDVYQKFVNILDARPHIRDRASAPKLKVNPPVPLRQVDPPQMPAMGNPTLIPRASLGSNWVPGKIPTDEEESKKLFSYRILFPSNRQCLLPRYPIPYHPSRTRGPNLMRENWQSETPTGQGAFLQLLLGMPQWNCFQRDPSLDKMPKQGASALEVAWPTRGILHPSKLPRRDLKYSEERPTLLDSQGSLIGCV